MKKKIKISWKNLSIWNIILVLLSCKEKKYIEKWMNITPCPIDSVVLYQEDGKLILHFNDFCAGSFAISSLCLHSLCKSALGWIAKRENMRNAEELCSWLDMKTI